jgi:glycerate 2-kinase
MKILICPDKFKECLTAAGVAAAIREGVHRAVPGADCRLLPLADGGEGTQEVLTEATGGRQEPVHVHDPLMRTVTAQLGVSGDGHTAFIEMARASGLALLSANERNPLHTSTFGTGELIRHALDLGCSEMIVGIGGSATVDGGVGMARALGMSFTDDTGWELPPGGGSLGSLFRIDTVNRDSRLAACRIFVACDVQNPLTGPLGAAHVFGPQKGATPEMALLLDANLKHLARIIREQLHTDVEFVPGAGAAGGLGAGLAAFLGAEMKAGFEVVAMATRLEEQIRWADVVITGEGRLDAQTGFGKTPAGVGRLAAAQGKQVIAFTGHLAVDADVLAGMGITVAVPIADRPMGMAESMQEAPRLLANAAERTFRIREMKKNG